MKIIYTSIVVLSLLAAGLTYAICAHFVFPNIEDAHLLATKFAVGALIAAELLSCGLLCGTIALANRRNVPYAMAFPQTLALYIFVAIACVPASIYWIESRTTIAIIHACVLFIVVFFAFGFLTAGTVGKREGYEAGRRKVLSHRENFAGVVELISAKNSLSIKKEAGKLADDLAYSAESVPACENLDIELEQRICDLKTTLENGNQLDEESVARTLREVRSLVERRERVIKQNL